ncbi:MULTISPECIES: D-lactate dehydrogenase [unclassified Ruegeria]|uniref:D-lactate dehydrogenase n=1 Tax=unclassified Ruegeria TaxID=2625375 RepID=UPI001ADCCD95|nr:MULTISPECIES: D-lactate dehydrogenase [unclassified Ruegeria]MBO9413585.1 D-lactate dehydrogenase [Ruegeria sp. R8_1]MBO9417571.1 D-lactate dehydrogenase [Ruegeria sp. R8_2]
MTNDALISDFRAIVGSRHVLTGARATERFRRGFRSGEGEALCVVQPGTLLEQWKVLQACVAADKIVIMQAANTGLTEGSTPSGRYDRDVVLINTRRMDTLVPLNNGEQVISFPGATLFALEKLLAPIGREPHSVIGSSCIGASIVGGVCNNSGGSLVERGPVYTELSVYARITADGTLELVNHLGIDLGETPEQILSNLDAGQFERNPGATNKRASASDYAQIVRDVDAETPARYNADKAKLFESAGSAGKMAVFAVRLDTFAKNEAEQVFYIGTNSPDDLADLRRHILSQFASLPVSAEYMQRDVFDITKAYGKDTVWMIDKLGTDRLPMFFALKGAVDARLRRIPFLRNFTDRFMQAAVSLLPQVLPKRMTEYRDAYEHHLILKMKDEGIEAIRDWLPGFFEGRDAGFFECTPREAKIAGLHRFAAAGAAVRYMAIHADEVEDIIALDVALRRNDRDWLEVLPPEISNQIVHKLYYGHFMCHVMHQDYVVRKGADPKALKAAMLELFDARGAEYPAEHNVGHLYKAKPDLAAHYTCCDPTNSFNPGIGKMSKSRNYGEGIK